jgi:hypothetical protein
MRKGKRFTPALLDKWEFMEARGTGVYGDYQPWHQVTRADPSSRGRSHLTYCPKTHRLRHHLSDGEQLMFAFAWMTPHVIDIREQFKLETSGHQNALSQYSTQCAAYMHQGTKEIADEMHIKAPLARNGKQTGVWRLTTDFLITTKRSERDPHLIAVAYKPITDLLSPRKRDLLRIEQRYWQNEGATWLLITPGQFSASVALTVKTVIPWVLNPEQASDALKLKCADVAKMHTGKPLQYVLQIVSGALNIDLHNASVAFYQAVWAGMLPLDLSRSRFISDPLRLLSVDDFWRQNPIVSKRSACL